MGWDDVWTGCGGYEAEFRRAGSAAWTRIEIFSDSSVEINLPLPFGPVNDPTNYALRVRSFWGLRNDTRQFSDWSATANIEIFLSPLRSITFPQLALGGGFAVVLLISNRANQNWTGSALLKQGNDESWSTPWTLDGKSGGAGSAFEISLTAHETQKFLLKGDLEVRAGYLSIVPDEGVSASGISVAFFYNFIDGQLRHRFDWSDPRLTGNRFYLPGRKDHGSGYGESIRGLNDRAISSGDDVVRFRRDPVTTELRHL